MDIEPNWRLASPGVLALGSTQFEIRYEAPGLYRVYHGGQSHITWHVHTTIDAAKQCVARLVRDMLAMGVDP